MKHPVPKQKLSPSRTKKRRSASETSVKKKLTKGVNLTKCPQCGEKKLQHHVCTFCGTYNGRQVIKVGKSTKKIKTIKA